MEAFTIRRDDTNALLNFNFELPISETALQIDGNFLEGTASSLPACHVRGARASFPSSRQLKGEGSELVSAPQEVPKTPRQPLLLRDGGVKGQLPREGQRTPESRASGGVGGGRREGGGRLRAEKWGVGGGPLSPRPLGRSLL